MQIDFRGINTPRDLQEFHLPSGDPGDYWWPRAQMRLQVVWLPVEEIDGPQPGMAPHRREGWPEIWIKEDKQAFFFWRHGLSLSLNLEEGRAEARISYKNDWQSILRILYFFGFLEERGLLLHASGLVHRGLAYIFPGVSGAGKTTIVRLSPQLPLLSDEIYRRTIDRK